MHVKDNNNNKLINKHKTGEFDFVQGKTKNGVAIRVFSPPSRAEQGF
jgi:hypothetical protein